VAERTEICSIVWIINLRYLWSKNLCSFLVELGDKFGVQMKMCCQIMQTQKGARGSNCCSVFLFVTRIATWTTRVRHVPRAHEGACGRKLFNKICNFNQTFHTIVKERISCKPKLEKAFQISDFACYYLHSSFLSAYSQTLFPFFGNSDCFMVRDEIWIQRVKVVQVTRDRRIVF
jgi:hypothetical protein